VITIPELAEQLGSYPNGMINAERTAMRKNWTFKNTVLTKTTSILKGSKNYD
jgi:hypothetical protein